MSNESEPREISIVREEIDKLNRYLNGLPEKLRKGTAFYAYEKRLTMLERELISSWCLTFKDANDKLQNASDDRVKEQAQEVMKLCRLFSDFSTQLESQQDSPHQLTSV